MNRPEFEKYFRALLAVEQMAYADKIEDIEGINTENMKPYAYNSEKAINETYDILFDLDQIGREAYIKNILIKIRTAAEILEILFDKDNKLRTAFEEKYDNDTKFYFIIANKTLNSFAYNLYVICESFGLNSILDKSNVFRIILPDIAAPGPPNINPESALNSISRSYRETFLRWETILSEQVQNWKYGKDKEQCTAFLKYIARKGFLADKPKVLRIFALNRYCSKIDSTIDKLNRERYQDLLEEKIEEIVRIIQNKPYGKVSTD